MEKMVKNQDLLYDKCGIINLTQEGFACLCEAIFIEGKWNEEWTTMRYAYKSVIFVLEQHGDEISLEIIN